MNKKQNALMASVEAAIQHALPQHYPTIQVTAACCGVSARTLQRFFASAGSNYSELVDQIRCAAAIRRLTESETKTNAC